MPVLGIDVGTQSLKAVVFGADMRLLGAGSVPYQPNFPQAGWAEQDPRLWLDALGPAIGRALADALGPAIGRALAEARVAAGDISALAVCGQLDGCVPVDAGGRSMGPAVIWMDRRAEGLLRDIDPEPIHQRCGLVLDATHMGGKIAWLQREEALFRLL